VLRGGLYSRPISSATGRRSDAPHQPACRRQEPGDQPDHGAPDHDHLTVAATTVTTSTVTTSTGVATTSTTPTTSPTSTTLYGSPSRAFVEPVRSLLD
jgi:hypothetical protein